jgi:hypothetical protein
MSVSLTEVIRLLPDSKKNNGRIWAGYSLLWLPLAASTSNVKQTITTQDDSDFIVMRIQAYATTNATPPVENATPQATFTLSIGSNAIFPDNNPVHIGMFLDNATKEGGKDMEFPVLVPAQTTFTAFGNNLTATDIMLRVTMFGIRVFNAPRPSNQL